MSELKALAAVLGVSVSTFFGQAPARAGEAGTHPDTGQPHTSHTVGPVPLVYVGRKATLRSGGALRDIAPTLLYLLGLPAPQEMTGRPLVQLA